MLLHKRTSDIISVAITHFHILQPLFHDNNIVITNQSLFYEFTQICGVASSFAITSTRNVLCMLHR